MRAWRLDALTNEACRNLLTSWVRTLVVFVAVSGMVGALTWSELTTTEGILAFHRGFVSSGGNIVVASNPGRISAERCEMLVFRPDVVAAGSLSIGDTVETRGAPNTPFQTASISPGTLRVWGVSEKVDMSSGIALGSAAADELGRSTGMYISIDRNRPQLVTVIDVERRNPHASRWILLPAPAVGDSDNCWAELEPGAASTGHALLGHIFADSGPELSVRSLIRPGEFGRVPVAELLARPQRNAWIIGGALVTLFLWLTLWLRRSELSLYRALGTSRPALLYLAQVETLIVLLLAGAAGYLWAVSIFSAVTGLSPAPDQYAIAARAAGSTLAVPGIMGPIMAVLIGGQRTLLNQLKER